MRVVNKKSNTGLEQNGTKSLVKVEPKSAVVVPEAEVLPLLERCLQSVREEMRDSPYIVEALRVLPVGGYRSAIGSFWNAVVDDLRNKIIARSLSLFNKSITIGREIKTYEDFQNYVNDDQLIEGAYKIGVIGWEASKVLKHAKETRHIFDGHPRSSEPSILKVLAMMDDCVKYVLNAEYPAEIIDIDEYMTILGDQKFDRNAVGVENAIGELPEVYKNELANRLFSAYVHASSPTILRSNIEFVAPILWRVLPKDVKIQVIRRVDQEITKGNVDSVIQAFAFVRLVNAQGYLTATARRYKVQPLVERLKNSLDNWKEEDEVVRDLEPYASVVPPELLQEYVAALTQTYVGKIGYSSSYARTDFYADGAALSIPKMFEVFDDRAAQAFIDAVRENRILRERIRNPQKLQRLRALANIVLERSSGNLGDHSFLETLVAEDREEEFLALIGKKGAF